MTNSKRTFLEYINDEKSMTYNECNDFWESSNAKVHSDTSDALMEEIAEHIVKRMRLNTDDVLLVIGGGGGYIDRFITPKVKKLLAIDFSEQKINDAKERNPQGDYFIQNFLEDYNYLKEYGINKVYSYSVMQYCKPKDFELFIKNQLSVMNSQKDKLIGHLDVPDLDKSFYYYNKLCEGVSESDIRNNREKIKYLIGDGSCWHDMYAVKKELDSIKRVHNSYFLDAHYWKFRTDIMIEII